MSNPLLEPFEAPFETAPFDQIKPEHFLPAIKKSIEIAKAEIAAITGNVVAQFIEIGRAIESFLVFV